MNTVKHKETVHVVIDIETASTQSDAAVVSIGAACFVADDIQRLPIEFYGHLKIEDCENVGLNIDDNTIVWWSQQNVEMRDEAFKGTDPEGSSLATLCDFVDWYTDLLNAYENVRVWGNGANFDPVVLGNCMDAFDVIVPWKYRDVRCLRTLLKLLPERHYGKQPDNLKHHALWDARYEAANLKLCLKYLQKSGVDLYAI